MKTAAIYYLQGLSDDQPISKKDFAASYQEAIVDSLMSIFEKAVKETNVPTISGGGGTGAVGLASIGINNTQGFNEVKNIFVINSGQNYTSEPTVTISDPETISGIGTYHFNEVVQGMRSGTQARVKNWDYDTKILKVGNVGISTTTTAFFPGEDIKGLTSGALFSVSVFDDENSNDKYNEGDIFESEADLLIDFSESNPFGSF